MVSFDNKVKSHLNRFSQEGFGDYECLYLVLTNTLQYYYIVQL